MEIFQMINNQTSKNQKEPSIYYEVINKKRTSNPNVIKFKNNDPIKAREEAFAFLENEMRQFEIAHLEVAHPNLEEYFIDPFEAYFTDRYAFLNPNFGGQTLQKYHANEMVFQEVIQKNMNYEIYLVAEQPIQYKTPKKAPEGQHFLIYSLDINKTELIINGLIREYHYYSQLKYCIKNYLHILYLDDAITDYGEVTPYIISTPIDWIKLKYDYSTTDEERIKYSDQMFNRNEIMYYDNTYFTTQMDEKKWAKLVAAFLNSESGFIVYGMDKREKAYQLFNNINLNDFVTEINLLKQKYFPEDLDAITLQFVLIENIVVAVFKITSNKYSSPKYVCRKNKKKLYILNNSNVYQLKGKAKKKFKANFKANQDETVKDILEFL